MADYIRREDALFALRKAERGGSMTALTRLERAYAEIREMPAADVAEVVHGKWFWADDGYCRCSECTQKAPLVQPLDDEPEAVMTKYCPNCGAKMDGREK